MRGRIFYAMGVITILVDFFFVLEMVDVWDIMDRTMRYFMQIHVLLWIFIGFTQIAVGWLLEQEHKRNKA